MVPTPRYLGCDDGMVSALRSTCAYLLISRTVTALFISRDDTLPTAPPPSRLPGTAGGVSLVSFALVLAVDIVAQVPGRTCTQEQLRKIQFLDKSVLINRSFLPLFL